MLPKKLRSKLDTRKQSGALRTLNSSPTDNGLEGALIDFSSNDYLGFAGDASIFFRASEILKEHNLHINGATGSRLLTGNHTLYTAVEDRIATIHNSDAALIFNSGYDANLGFFQSVPQRGDLIFYDALIHASIRDGLQLSLAKSFKFKHNDLTDLEKQLKTLRGQNLNINPEDVEIYVVTESVFSMDGDSPDLAGLTALCRRQGIHLVVDEAHALGVIGEKGLGLVPHLDLQQHVFARLVTFGKALGGHGAAILCSADLKSYLVNFARSLIYTTALPPHALATVLAAYERLELDAQAQSQNLDFIENLQKNIESFNLQLATCNLQPLFIPSNSAIHCATIPGNERVKNISKQLAKKGFDVKPILSPTVPKSRERLRFCLHSFNTKREIEQVLSHLVEAITL